MAQFADRVQETSTTTGTGNVTVLGAVTNRVTIASRVVVGEQFYYTIDGGTEYEDGVATLLTSTTFSRDYVETSSNGDAAVNFSAGTKNVWINLPAVRACGLAPKLISSGDCYTVPVDMQVVNGTIITVDGILDLEGDLSEFD